MTVRQAEDGTIVLEGLCPIEDAEVLLRYLLLSPESALDWAGCDQAHTAVIQVLLAARPSRRGAARLPFLSRWVEPALRAP